jgi:protein-disulfide isomerase
MPLAIHPDAFNAARASVCAAEQGRFWEYHDMLFGSSDLTEPTLQKYVAELGLAHAEFNICLKSETSSAAVRRDMREALQADVQGTPTFFVNGKVIRGIKSLEDFKSVIDQALQARNDKARQNPKR